jgi:hypothetical protein
MASLPGARLRAVLAGAVAILAGCGGSSNPPSPGPPGGGGNETITGRERIGWTQQAIDAEQLSTFDYAAYVDGVRRVLEGASCPGTSGAAFECSAPLPPMTPGQHTIELVSFTVAENGILESERSAALRVTVSAHPLSSMASTIRLTWQSRPMVECSSRSARGASGLSATVRMRIRRWN